MLANTFLASAALLAASDIAAQARKRPPGFVQRFAPATDTSRTPTVDRIPDPESPELDTGWGEEWEKNLCATSKQLRITQHWTRSPRPR